MSELSKIKRELSQLEKTERELNLKQLQINGLLGITQAINNNVSADGLYEMYASFVGWEMAVEKVALLVKENSEWVCKVYRGIDKELIKMDISDRLPNYQRLKNIEEDKDHPLIKEFDVVIPVLHKNTPIAYSFFGGFGKNDDMYSKVKFITTITNIIAVAIENKRLFKRQIEQERLNREMELAGDMQKMLIPNKLPKNEKYEFAGIYKPHLGLG
jgi:sigma-B regulation protein RsbU (phosphoserine phosphatase)